MSDPLIDSLARAVDAAPDDIRLRTHLAELLIEAGRQAEAVTQCATALQCDPTDEAARELMARALSARSATTPQDAHPEPHHRSEPGPASPVPPPSSPVTLPAPPADAAAGTPAASLSPNGPAAGTPAGVPAAGTQPGTPEAGPSPEATEDTEGFDWHRAEKDLTTDPAALSTPSGPDLVSVPVKAGDSDDPDIWEVEKAGITLADVGGMTEVKNRLEASFLAPMRNPELRRLYGKSLCGGLLLYGPPGTGKTFIARAVAGQMGAGFLNVTITDILDPYIGNSEANLHKAFEQAREHSPCVLFLDELDAIGIKRSLSRSSGIRGTVNQLLEELDGIGSDNEGVYLLAATNAPWDIDPALRRPGRLDRSILVLPPDGPARAAILRTHLRERPAEGIDLQELARTTDGLTGADLSHLCDSAAEMALLDSVRTGSPRLITMEDMLAALREIRPSSGPWFEVARNVIEYADSSGEYAELREWMKRHRLL